jgi:L-lactate dehydrogenase complex protein LldE
VSAAPRGRIGLFVTCLVDLFRPTVGFAAASLLERAGYAVEVPIQTCCGQPGYNGGDRASARRLAQDVIAAFEGYDFVVAPSGSCAGMIRVHYPALFAGDPEWAPRAARLASRTHELVAFLVDVAGVTATGAGFSGTVTYHDACSGLRELGVHDQPRRLLGTIPGLALAEMGHPEVCCGFGGTFCVKYPAISTRLAADKVADAAATGAGTLLAGDLGCLLNLAGRLGREGRTLAVRHVAEVLAGMADGPAIGAASRALAPRD